MRIEQIESVLAVVESGSVAAAARRLGQSRTTVSTAISALEDELGVTLFERSGNRPECVNLYPTVEAIFPDYGKPTLGTSTVGG